MIALAILFIVIIGLLWLIVRLLQHFFDTYSSLDENEYASDFENKLKKQKVVLSCQERNKEINTLISKRLMELDQKLQPLNTHNRDSEMLISALRQLLHSSLNLLK